MSSSCDPSNTKGTRLSFKRTAGVATDPNTTVASLASLTSCTQNSHYGRTSIVCSQVPATIPVCRLLQRVWASEFGLNGGGHCKAA